MSPLLFKRLSDERLGSRLALGEAAAFDELYRRYVHRLAAYGSHLLGDPAAGDDVAQATLLKAYGVLRDGRVPDKMRPWLFRIAHNTAIDLVVRRRELPAAQLPEVAARDAEPLAGALVASLAALPERQRRVYVLRELHGMRIAETAAELGLTSTQVEQALFAARNRLAELLMFGERLDCVTVQRLAAGPLDATERRALKTHLRSCAPCRSAVPLRTRAPVWSPGPSFEWLRGLLVGGAGPAVAKVGAVVATATIAGSVPAVAQRVEREPVPHPRPAPVHVRAVSAPVRASVVKAAPVVFRAAAPVRVERPRPTYEHVSVEHVPVEHVAASHEHHAVTVSGNGGDRHGGDGFEHSEPSGPASPVTTGVPTAVTPETTTTEVTDDGHSGEAAETTVAGLESRSLGSGDAGGSGDSGRDGGSEAGSGGGGSSGESGSGDGGGDGPSATTTTGS